MKPTRYGIVMTVTLLAVAALAVGVITCGSVDIPCAEVWRAIFGDGASKTTWQNIIIELRIPSAITAAIAGMSLAVSGLLMQTSFNNPLAGPSIMGVSTGASLGVAIMVMIVGVSAGGIGILGGALLGAGLVILVLTLLSRIVRSTLMLLITGIMVGYLTSSAISLINYFASRESIHTFVIWGLGTFGDVTLSELPMFVGVCLLTCAAAFLMIKPLNAMLLGDRYAANLGVNVKTSRTLMLLIAGIQTAAVTAWCGPVAFIGLAVPHMARLATNTSDHSRLLPATAAGGAAIGLLTQWLAVIPGQPGVIPINAITPLLGVPVIIYIIICRRQINYFN